MRASISAAQGSTNQGRGFEVARAAVERAVEGLRNADTEHALFSRQFDEAPTESQLAEYYSAKHEGIMPGETQA